MDQHTAGSDPGRFLLRPAATHPDVLNSWSITRSDRADLNDKDMLKLLNLERFLVDLMIPSDRKAL
ncbi:hypothetical protein [Pseudoxanthobacter soli]|uniref:hypothetical protein n=1 Tax=Pseudoxanthobacter soli TaxID=433840 RepID=UPI0011148E33|nr:hypothetical protein [Pseudoxanthobacter soli]